MGVGLSQSRGEPGPRTRPARTVEAGHVTDLGDEHRGQHVTDPADVLDHPIAGINTQQPMDASVGLVDLTWTRHFRPADFDPSSSERDLAITARMITILRRRGRLSGALDVLTHLGSLHDRRGRDRAHRPSWEGRLVHEELALHRRCEDQAAVREVLAIAGEWQSLLVGANWLMWIEDEWAGAALRDGDLDAAESHVRRCRELAAAYGSHPLALGAIEVRALEIEIERLLVTDRERALSDIRQRRSDLALRLKNDPLRALELEGLVAETRAHLWRSIDSSTALRRSDQEPEPAASALRRSGHATLRRSDLRSGGTSAGERNRYVSGRRPLHDAAHEPNTRRPHFSALTLMLTPKCAAVPDRVEC